ncbi:MAG: SCP2 sterol-binding domain-containing protein [Lachnospiraceae bacterium]
MKVNIYYGGRGLVDDPTIAVINKIQGVLEELRVTVSKYNLYEIRNGITTLPLTLKEVDAVVLATTVEWLGIGGLMQQFLDACWLYGDKSKISELYMFPVVMSKTYGERQAYSTLVDSWEILGGKVCNGLSAYVDDSTDFEFNKDYSMVIERKAEEIYRTVSQKTIMLPSSSKNLRNMIKETVNFTPQESEQLSKFVSDEKFVQTQKKDIEDLSSAYKEMLVDEANGGDEYYTSVFKKVFKPQGNISASYYLIIDDKQKSVVIDVRGSHLDCHLGTKENADIIAKLKKETFDRVVNGRMTFQRAFMTGDITAKGNLKTIKMFDEFFKFEK